MKKVLLLLTIVLTSSCKKDISALLGKSSCSKETQCFSSYDRSVDGIKFQGTKEDAKKALKTILKRSDMKILKDKGDYILAEHCSWLGGTQMIELNFLNNLIHLKSTATRGSFTFNKGRTLLNEISFKYYQRDY